MKNVFFVYCEFKFFKNTFKKSKVSEVLSEPEIKKKLQSRDIQKKEPSEEVVRYFLSKKISNFVSSKKAEFLYLHIDNMENEMIQRIKSFMNSDFAVRNNITVFVMADSIDRYEKIKTHFDRLVITENFDEME